MTHLLFIVSHIRTFHLHPNTPLDSMIHTYAYTIDIVVANHLVELDYSGVLLCIIRHYFEDQRVNPAWCLRAFQVTVVVSLEGS